MSDRPSRQIALLLILLGLSMGFNVGQSRLIGRWAALAERAVLVAEQCYGKQEAR